MPRAGENARHPITHNVKRKTHHENCAARSTPRVDLTTFGGRFQTFFRASAKAHFLRVYLKNNWLLVFGL
jgi:hypothetical protein